MVEIIKSIVLWIGVNWVMLDTIYSMDLLAEFSSLKKYEQHTIRFNESSVWKKKYFPLWKREKRILKLSIALLSGVLIMDFIWISIFIVQILLGDISLSTLYGVCTIFMYLNGVICMIGVLFYRNKRSKKLNIKLNIKKDTPHVKLLKKKRRLFFFCCQHRIKGVLWNTSLKTLYCSHYKSFIRYRNQSECPKYIAQSKSLLQWLDSQKGDILVLIRKNDIVHKAYSMENSCRDDTLFYDNLIPVYGEIIFADSSNWSMQLAIFCKYKNYLQNSYIQVDISNYQIKNAFIVSCC